LGPAALVSASYPLPTQLGGTSIKISAAGAMFDALMVYTSAAQVAAILPSKTPAGAATLTLTYNGQATASTPIRVGTSAFGMFTLNQGGDGPAVVTNPAFQVITVTSPAKPGDVLTLWGTGLGAYSGDESSPPSIGDLPLNLKLYVGGVEAVV